MALQRFDHLVLACAELDQARAWARQCLNAEIPFGGAHPRMGTHNLLTGTDEDSFLELIAIDPAAPTPGRTRWFDLDGSDPPPTPVARAWVAATDDMSDTLARARAAGLDLGEPVEVRRGDLAWLMAIRPDGAVPENGTLPMPIQWPVSPPPARAMRDVGVRYRRLRLRHPDPDWLQAALQELGWPAGPPIDIAAAEMASVGADLLTASNDLIQV
jgi:hypothetical protein